MTEKKRIEEIRAAIIAARDQLENLVEERASYFEARSTRWQESDVGGAYADRTSFLETAASSLDEAISTLDEMDG
jgi:hypothetical protein